MNFKDLIRPFRGHMVLIVLVVLCSMGVSLFFMALRPHETDEQLHSASSLFYIETPSRSDGVSKYSEAAQAAIDINELFESSVTAGGLIQNLIVNGEVENPAQSLDEYTVTSVISEGGRAITLNASGPDKSTVESLLGAARAELEQYQSPDVAIELIAQDEPSIDDGSSLGLTTQVVKALGFGLAIGVAISIIACSVLSILHPLAWDADQLESLGLPVLGTINFNERG